MDYRVEAVLAAGSIGARHIYLAAVWLRGLKTLLVECARAQQPHWMLSTRRRRGCGVSHCHGWDVPTGLNRNQPELYQSAMRLFVRRPAGRESPRPPGNAKFLLI